MKQIKTSTLMRAIVADASRPGWQRDAASRVLTEGKRPTWRALYDILPTSMPMAAGWSRERRMERTHEDPARIKAVHDDLVALAKHYGIQPTEDA